MKQLQKIGYWSGEFTTGYIWPQEIASRRQIYKDVSRINSYLKGGYPAIHWKGLDHCRICKETLGSKCMTDGVWMWPEGMEHYVVRHNIRLPEEFFIHMREQKWRHPKVRSKDRVTEEFAHQASEEFWREWCRKNARPELRPSFQPRVYKRPQTTGEGVISADLLNNLFAIIESGDIAVTRLEVDRMSRLSKKLLKAHGCKDKDGWRLWTAGIYSRNKLVLAASDPEYGIKAAVAFEKKKPICYCNNITLVGGDDVRFCPSL